MLTRPAIVVGEDKKARPNAPNTDAENEMRRKCGQGSFAEKIESRVYRRLL